ncbi:MAG TPA: DUF4105 domain-containing protein [Bdellovibrionota bacterium]|nr:DUF4105 domain-containing protein [Bdellovibrionota bacterium]
MFGRCRPSAWLIFFLGSLLAPLFTGAVAAGDDSTAVYLSDLQARAREKKLADSRYWQLLLRYMPRLLGGVKSEADDPTFFLASDGKTDPRAELDATLTAFFFPEETNPERQHPQCRFRGRYGWLKKELDFDPARLREYPCPRFEEWRSNIDAHGLSLLFSSYYVNNPASMFGHTLVRFDRVEESDSPDLLAYATNYAGATGDDNGIFFAVKGLIGSYHGEFSVYPYYFKVQEYANFESRDIWEYKLNIPSERAGPVIEHLWEIGHSYFDYYFFDENCSYHLLGLIEVADPKLRLRDHWGVFVAPSDTVKRIQSQAGLVRSITYRPSLLSQLKQRRAGLNSSEDKKLRGLVHRELSLDDPELSSLAPERKALVADAAIDYLFYKNRTRRTPFQRKLLQERSHLPDNPPVESEPLSTPPHEGHDTKRVGASFGVNKDDTFEEFRFRGAFHDLLARDEGYPADSEIEALRLAFRYYNKERAFRVEDAALINIFSIYPSDLLIVKPSWNVSFGLETLRNDDCGRCNDAFLRGGAGLATDRHLMKREVYYIFANANFEASPWSEVDFRLGPQATAGILVDVFEWWKLHLRGSFDYSPLGAPDVDYSGSLDQRLAWTKNTEFRLEATKFKRGAEALLALHYYF